MTTTKAGPRTKARKDYEEAWQNGYEAGKTEERERLEWHPFGIVRDPQGIEWVRWSEVESFILAEPEVAAR